MDPHNFIARAEAQRWLGIAEKLLIGNDLVGSKTFAIRARDSDPRLEAADQILAIADTLLAADKRVVAHNGSQQPDFYAILQLLRFINDADHIAAQYRRLAVLLNPHQNRFPYADQAFQLVNDAYAVLSNPMRKSLYDADLEFPQHQHQINNLGFNIEQELDSHPHQQHHQQQHNFFSVNRLGPSREQEMVQSSVHVQPGHHQHQLHQHNFLSQNPVRAVPVRDPEQMFHHRDHEHLFQQQPQPFQVTAAVQQTRPLQQPMQSTSPPSVAPPQTSFSWPQAPPLVPPVPLVSQQQLFQQQQQEKQPQESRQQDDPSRINSNNDARGEETEEETETADENVDDSPSFWTTCPYCFYMYEYPKAYVECVLRCNTCKRAFQAVRIPSPPQISEDQESYYCCWGFFPLAISMSDLQKNNGGTQTNSNWSPFSPMCDVSSQVKDHLNDVKDHLNEKAAPKKNVFANENLGPPIYIDDETDDIFDGISEPSDDSDSDLEWNSSEKKKAKRMKKERVSSGRNGNAKNRSSVPVTKKSSGVTTRRQSGRAAKEMGRLDLNVEFNNNEGEEPAARAGAGNRGNGQGEGDNIEGIGFFEGLDEFFSSLPILSVVNDDKVKAA